MTAWFLSITWSKSADLGSLLREHFLHHLLGRFLCFAQFRLVALPFSLLLKKCCSLGKWLAIRTT